MRSDLKAVVEALLQASQAGGKLPLNQLGDALGTLLVSHAEIELVIDELEAAGREVDVSVAGSSVAHLQLVLKAARKLKADSQQSLTVSQICEATGLSAQAVSQALALARVMQR